MNKHKNIHTFESFVPKNLETRDKEALEAGYIPMKLEHIFLNVASLTSDGEIIVDKNSIFDFRNIDTDEHSIEYVIEDAGHFYTATLVIFYEGDFGNWEKENWPINFTAEMQTRGAWHTFFEGQEDADKAAEYVSKSIVVKFSDLARNAFYNTSSRSEEKEALKEYNKKLLEAWPKIKVKVKEALSELVHN